jgi:hypothetical protein
LLSKVNSLLTDKYLTHYWPIDNGKMTDVVGTAHMTQGYNTYFRTDRFGNSYSALDLNHGWTQLPSGVYFDTPEFTISVWVYPFYVGSYSRIIDFGNGQNQDNIIFALSEGTSLKPYFSIIPFYDGFRTNTQLTLNEWQFLAATYDGSSLKIYKNGNIISNTLKKISMPRITRTKCYIGKSNWNDGSSTSFLDELRFYRKSLTELEINELMKRSKFIFFGFINALLYRRVLAKCIYKLIR